ncbi:MAG: hypothetical protein HXX19_07385 [Rhodoferax sp.]|nr:hypothetical protein [Rhodoferax sp.]
MGFQRRLVFWLVLAVLGSTLSGCVIRPLGWGEHGYRHGERYDAHQEHQERSNDRRGDWR